MTFISKVFLPMNSILGFPSYEYYLEVIFLPKDFTPDM